MKKYLMMALAVVAFASCSKSDDVSDPNRNENSDKYTAAFTEAFGSINSQVNWGFENQTVPVFNAEGMFTGTRSSKPNNNEWGMYLNVPAEMTAAQKAKVKKYFDEVNKPQGISVNWSDFFVHQVSQTDRGPYMNYLYCGEKDYAAKDHVYNFNGGSSTDKKNVGVEPLDAYNAKQVDYYDGIQLVQNSSTELFAFHNSYDDTYYEKNFVMVSGEMIDAAYPEEPSVAGMWFVGFDYEHDKTKMGENDIVKRDYYFNDWVIRVSPGFYRNSKRVFVEDLIDSDLDNVDKSDWDFNDAVFDAAFLTSSDWSTGSEVVTVTDAIVTLWAAGGTKKLTIDGNEVHSLFGVNTNVMVNTDASAYGAAADGLAPVIFRVSAPAEPNANLIPVYVNTTELKAETGKATQKVEVSNTTRWMKEKKQLTGSYSDFKQYVNTNAPKDWYRNVTDASALYY